MLPLRSSISFLELFVLNTIVYFDLFDYPLTDIELYEYLYTNGMEGETYSFQEIQEEFTTSTVLKRSVTQQQGFYVLKGREEIIETRHERYAHSFSKFSIALRGARLIRFLPFVQSFAVCNNLASNNAQEDSDIDVFIITQKNRLFLTRFFVTLLCSLFRLRRHGKKIANRLCLSFYVTDNDLNFEQLQTPGKDIYLPYWVAQVFPLYDRDGNYTRFMNANEWVVKYLPHMRLRMPSYRRKAQVTSLSRTIQKSLEIALWGPVGLFCEFIVKTFQITKMSTNKKSVAREHDTRVIISNTMLKFHENDRRERYARLHDERLASLIS